MLSFGIAYLFCSYAVIGLAAANLAKNANFPKSARAVVLLAWPVVGVIVLVRAFINQVICVFSD